MQADAKSRERKKAPAKERVVENRDREVRQEQAGEEVVAAPKEEAPAEKAPEDKDRAAGGEDLYKFERPAVEEESYAWIIFKTIFIIGLLVGGFYYFFRFVAKKSGIQLPGGGGLIQVLATLPMGQNKFLQVVDLAGKVLVLGVSDNAVSLLMEIKDKEEIDRIRLAGSRTVPVQPGGFQEFLTKQVARLMNLRREGAVPAAATAPAAAAEPVPHGEAEAERLDFLSRQRERLKRMNGTDEAE